MTSTSFAGPLPSSYHLYGIIVHSGSARKGHYLSMIRPFLQNNFENYESNDKWIQFDDSHVRWIEEVDAISGSYGGNDTASARIKRKEKSNASSLFYLRDDELQRCNP